MRLGEGGTRRAEREVDRRQLVVGQVAHCSEHPIQERHNAAALVPRAFGGQQGDGSRGIQWSPPLPLLPPPTVESTMTADGRMIDMMDMIDILDLSIIFYYFYMVVDMEGHTIYTKYYS